MTRKDLLGRNDLDKVTYIYQGLIDFPTASVAIPIIFHGGGLGSDRF